MTAAISSSQSQIYSPRDLLQNTLTSEIASGKINQSDQSALSDALDSIDQSLSASRGSKSGSGPRSPDQLKSQLDDLISQQVSSGKLTSDQADELKQVFQDTFSKGPKGAGGPPPGSPPPGGAPGDASSASDGTSSTASSVSDILKQLEDLLKQLSSSTSSYQADGNNNNKNNLSNSLFVDTSV